MRSSDRKTQGNEALGRAQKPDEAARGSQGMKPARPGGRRRILYRVLGIVIILAVVFSAEYVAQQCFDEVRLADYYRYDRKKLIEEGADVDMICVGASQIYHGCNPDVISQEMGIGEVLDCATASGQCDGGYYMLRDLLEHFSPKYVVLELPWHKFLKKPDRSVERGSLLAADCLPFADKLDYAIHCFRPYMYMNLFSMYRFGGNVSGISQLVSNYRAKKAVAEGNWVDESERSYRRNGFCWFDKSAAQGGLDTAVNLYSEDQIDPREREYLLKMYEMCREKGIQVIWVTLPSSLSEIYGVENFQAAINHSTEFAKETGCPYLNFCYWKGREEVFPDTLYTDRQHLNGEGSVVFSKLLCQMIKKTLDGEDISSFFYQDLEEMQADVHRIVAARALAWNNEFGSVTVEASCYCNKDMVPEYRLLAVKKKKILSELRGWTTEHVFTIEKDEIPEKASLRLEVRQAGAGEAEAFVKKIEIAADISVLQGGDPEDAQEDI